jgi:hypothetical protein
VQAERFRIGCAGSRFVPPRLVISIAYTSEQDGPTEVIFGDRVGLDPGAPLVFEGELETPTGNVVVSNVLRESILQMAVATKRIRLWIWTNHPQWPDKVIIGFMPANL